MFFKRGAQKFRNRLQNPENLTIQLLSEVCLGNVLVFMRVNSRNQSQNSSEVRNHILVSLGLIFNEIINFLCNLCFELREFFDAVEKHRVNVSQNSDYSNRRMLLLVHDVICQSNEQFREDFEELLRFEVFGWICHDHWDWFFEEVKEPLLVVSFSKVNRNPMSEFFIWSTPVHWLLHKSFDWHIVIEDFSFLDKSSSGNFGNFNTKAQLVLKVCKFCVEANQFFSDDVILFFNDFELFQFLFFFIKSRP